MSDRPRRLRRAVYIRPVMIAHLDTEFGEIRKEIVMSVVHEEAEKIVTQAAQSGAMPAANRGETKQTPGTLPPAIDEALAAAEADLAKAVGAPAKRANAPVVEPENAQNVKSADDPDAGHRPVPNPPAQAAEATSEIVDAAPAVERTEEATSEAVETATPDQAAVLDETTESESNTPTSDSMYSPDRAEQVVLEIEKGIRKLAEILRTEVSQQWQQAKSAFSETIGAQEKTDEAYGKARGLLDEIRTLKEEAVEARDEINQARDEAKLLRYDVRKAKQCAETSVDAAELAADQAQREVENVQNLKAVAC